MKLFELTGNQFHADFLAMLKLLKSQAETQGTVSVTTWPAINRMLHMQGYGSVDEKIISKIRDQIDPTGEIIKDVTSQGITLTSSEDEDDDAMPQDMGTAPKTMDQMARNVTRKEFG